MRIFKCFKSAMILICSLFKMSEWKTYARKTKLSSVPSLEKYVVRFNGLSRWIEAMVLNGESPERRAHVIEKFLNVAQVCLNVGIIRYYIDLFK